jgi:dipeptidyl aminopeptidase/acylaminoacyl peptidase
MVESGEGHGFLDEGDRAEAFKNILDFFAKHLGSANSAVKGRP